MKHLEVPTRTINDLKRSPQAVFEQAQPKINPQDGWE